MNYQNLQTKQSNKSENKNSAWWVPPAGYTVVWNHMEYLVWWLTETQSQKLRPREVKWLAPALFWSISPLVSALGSLVFFPPIQLPMYQFWVTITGVWACVALTLNSAGLTQAGLWSLEHWSRSRLGNQVTKKPHLTAWTMGYARYLGCKQLSSNSSPSTHQLCDAGVPSFPLQMTMTWLAWSNGNLFSHSFGGRSKKSRC